MAIYRIPCTWEMYGVLEIEADSLDEAIAIAEDDDTDLPCDDHYVDGSFEVDHALLEDGFSMFGEQK